MRFQPAKRFIIDSLFPRAAVTDVAPIHPPVADDPLLDALQRPPFRFTECLLVYHDTQHVRFAVQHDSVDAGQHAAVATAAVPSGHA